MSRHASARRDAEFRDVAGQPAGVAEHILCAQEQPRAGVPATGEHEARGKIPCGLKGRITLQIPRTGRHRIHSGGDPFQQRGLIPTALSSHCFCPRAFGK